MRVAKKISILFHIITVHTYFICLNYENTYFVQLYIHFFPCIIQPTIIVHLRSRNKGQFIFNKPFSRITEHDIIHFKSAKKKERKI